MPSPLASAHAGGPQARVRDRADLAALGGLAIHEHHRHPLDACLFRAPRAVLVVQLGNYHRRVHAETKQAPHDRWGAGGFLPHLPASLEQLDLLLLTVATPRKVHPDGIRFQGLRYLDPTLAAYVGEEIIVRYDPRDLGEVRLFHEGRFLCRAICPEIAGETVPRREVIQARNRRRRALRQTLKERQQVVDALLEVRRGADPEPEVPAPTPLPPPEPETTRLKRYLNE
jgi:putative transposase